MKNWKTSSFAIVLAVGQILERRADMPSWVWMIGEILTTVGTLGLGYSAADKIKTPKLPETKV